MYSKNSYHSAVKTDVHNIASGRSTIRIPNSNFVHFRFC